MVGATEPFAYFIASIADASCCCFSQHRATHGMATREENDRRVSHQKDTAEVIPPHDRLLSRVRRSRSGGRIWFIFGNGRIGSESAFSAGT